MFTWDYSRTREAPRQAVREGEDVAVERRDRPRLVDRGRPREGRPGDVGRGHVLPGPDGAGRRLARAQLGREGVAAVPDGGVQLADEPVPARRAGRAPLHRQDRGHHAVDRRQVLRGVAGDGRGAPRRGVRPVPRHQARRPLPRQREPPAAHRRRARRLPLGHDVHGHADHDRGARARGVRLHAPRDAGAAPQAAAALRDERRGPPRGLRRAVAAGVLRGAVGRGAARAAGVRVRGRAAHARSAHDAGGLGAHGHRPAHDHRDALRAPRAGRQPVPGCAVLQDRAELQEARPARRRRRLAPREVHRDRRHRVRGRHGHRRGVRPPRHGRRRPRAATA